MLLRARLFRYTAQVAAVLAAGLTSLGLLVLGLSLNPPTGAVIKLLTEQDRGPLDIRTLWLAAAVTVGSALLIGIALIIPKKGLSPSGAVSPTWPRWFSSSRSCPSAWPSSTCTPQRGACRARAFRLDQAASGAAWPGSGSDRSKLSFLVRHSHG